MTYRSSLFDNYKSLQGNLTFTNIQYLLLQIHNTFPYECTILSHTHWNILTAYSSYRTWFVAYQRFLLLLLTQSFTSSYREFLAGVRRGTQISLRYSVKLTYIHCLFGQLSHSSCNFQHQPSSLYIDQHSFCTFCHKLCSPPQRVLLQLNLLGQEYYIIHGFSSW